MAKGSCSCGAVRFEIDADLSDVYMCHCSICQRSTGTNGIAVVLFPKDSFRWLAGEDAVATWQKPGSDWHTWFCKVCGAKVPGENDPERMFAPAGSITEGGEAMKMAAHIWVSSKAPWDEIGGTARQHPEQFGSG